MGRPLFVTGIAYLLATRLAFMLGVGEALPVSAALLLSAVLCFALRERLKYMRETGAVFLAAAVAFASYALYCSREIFPVGGLADKTVQMEGLITDSDRGVKSVSYTVTASMPGRADMPDAFPVILRSFEPLEAVVGDVVRFRAKFSAADGSLWYKSRGISITGVGVENLEIIPADGFKLERALLRLRNTMSLNLYAKLKKESADVISAMILGQKNNIPPDVSNAMGKAGTAHLLAISGLHLSILSGFVLKLSGKSRLGALFAILSSFFFVFLVGFSASLLRSFIMTATALSGRLISKRSDSLNSLGFAMIICCVISPYWTLGWGLWLSVASTLGIIIFSAPVTAALQKKLGAGRFAKFVSEAGGVGIAAYAFTFPLLLLMSGWISIVSPLANVLVSPFIAFAILGGILCAVIPGTPLFAVPIAYAADYATRIIIRISESMAAAPFAIIAIDEAYLLILIFAACVMTGIMVKYRADKKLVTYACALLAVSFTISGMSHEAASLDKIELVTLSGYDSAILMRGGEAVILGAPDAYEISNMLKYLDFRGIREVPLMIAPDCGTNISSGVLRLNENYKIGGVIGPNDALICETLSDVLPRSEVYSGGYATVTALQKANIYINIINNDIYVDIGNSRIIKSKHGYKPGDISGEIRIYGEGVMELPEDVPPLFEPVGAYLFGESRVLL